jgi:hypothetical protein
MCRILAMDGVNSRRRMNVNTYSYKYSDPTYMYILYAKVVC